MVFMAKIVHSEQAPAEAVHYTFAGVEFDISGKGSYETTDPVVIGAAEAHPWLTVKRDPEELIQGAYREQVAPEDDPLSAVTSKANDPEAAAAAQAEADAVQPVALDAGQTQTEVVETGGVAETLAADDASKTSEKKGS